MSRIVSVWLRSWPIARLLQAQATTAAGSPADPVDPERPLALVAPGKGGLRLVTLNRAAKQGGLVVGELLANARSKVRHLQSRAADPAADATALRRLALWCLRYTPLVSPWDEANGADGLFLDITGSAHLFGGEAGLLTDLAGRLRHFGLRSRLAIVRSMQSKEGDHGRASFLLRSGYVPQGAIRFPAFGAAVAKELASADGDIPHTTKVVLVDPHGNIRGYYDTDENGLDEVFNRAQHVLKEARAQRS